jgi:hypothetical protein
VFRREQLPICFDCRKESEFEYLYQIFVVDNIYSKVNLFKLLKYFRT